MMPTRIHIPKDWKRRATRALSNLNRPGVAAVCFWCGHQYRIGECCPETEDDHLLQFSEYPKEGKLRIQKRKNTPNVGIIFLVGRTLLSITGFPFSTCSQQARFLPALECSLSSPIHVLYWTDRLSPIRYKHSSTTCQHLLKGASL
jgi:hypothetical protein